MGILSTVGKLFGSDKVIESGLDTLDKAFYTDQEKAKDSLELINQKTNAKVRLLEAYAPFKLAQRYIAFTFTFVFVFIMVNGVIGAMYGVIDVEDVKRAKEFANEMWLGEIMISIIGFYFGGGAVEGILSKRNEVKK